MQMEAMMKARWLMMTILWAALWSGIFLLSSLFLSSQNYEKDLFHYYLTNKEILFLNWIPIFLVTLLLSFLCRSMRTGIFISAILWNLLAYTHSLKVIYRQEPLKFSDISFLREASIMARRYSLNLDVEKILMVVALVALLVVLSIPLTVGSRPAPVLGRLVGSLLTFFLLVAVTANVLMDSGRYMALGTDSGLNIWQELNGFESKGFSYPLFYTLRGLGGYRYRDYDEQNAKELAKTFVDKPIPEGKKVNIVAIMLESFKDFKKYENPKLVFNRNPYTFWYELANDGIHGTLAVNTFGGGSITTESCFWSGYRTNPLYNRPRHTYVSYLKSQGYHTEAFHPSDGLFNNRHNIYPNVGFDNYFYSQNYFSKILHAGVLPDKEFFPLLMERFKEETKKDEPYFSWSITYQGHGPYPDSYIEREIEYVPFQEGYDRAEWFAFNNYLGSVADTSEQLRTVVDTLRDAEPTILILFGDHSPSMGDNAVGMTMTGIPADLSTIEGSINTYETPYIIWANPAARALYGKDFKGEGPTIDPNLLMTEVFHQLGWEGSATNASNNALMEHLTVTKPFLYREDGNWKKDLSDTYTKLFKDYQDFQYYRSNQVREDPSK